MVVHSGCPQVISVLGTLFNLQPQFSKSGATAFAVQSEWSKHAPKASLASPKSWLEIQTLWSVSRPAAWVPAFYQDTQAADAFTLRGVSRSSPLLPQQRSTWYWCHKQMGQHITMSPGLPVSEQLWPLALDMFGQPHNGFLPWLLISRLSSALRLNSHSLAIPFCAPQDLGNLWEWFGFVTGLGMLLIAGRSQG